MSRSLRVGQPPRTSDPDLAAWMREVGDALNGLPAFSISSTTNGPNGAVAGLRGTLLIDVGSVASTMWFKNSGSTTTGWQHIAVAGPILYGDLPSGSGTWQTGSNTTVTIARSLGVGSNLSIGALTGLLRADNGLVSVAVGIGDRTLFDHYATVGNGTTVETDLYSDTLAAGQLAANGEKIQARYAGTFVGTAGATQQIKVYFGGNVIFDSGALAIGAAGYYYDLSILIIREANSTVRCTVSWASNSATLPATSTYTRIPTITLSVGQILKVTGTAAGAGAASNQITIEEGTVQWVPSA